MLNQNITCCSLRFWYVHTTCVIVSSHLCDILFVEKIPDFTSSFWPTFVILLAPQWLLWPLKRLLSHLAEIAMNLLLSLPTPAKLISKEQANSNMYQHAAGLALLAFKSS